MRVVLLGRKPEIMMQLVAGLKQTAVEFAAGTSLDDLKLAFSEEAPSSVIMGATRQRQVRENVAAAGVELSEETLAELDRILAPAEAVGK